MVAIKGVFAATALAMSAPVALAQDVNAPSSDEEVVLVADTLVESGDDTIILEGNVEASYQGRILKADQVIYDRTSEKIRAIGNVIILDPDGTQRFAEEVEVTSNLSDGYAVGFSVRLPTGAVAVANSAVRQEGGRNALDQIVYTACEICEEGDTPTWALRARQAVLDEEDKMISYRDAVLEVGGIPVVYLPYFAHPDPSSGRRSGFMFPDFGVSSKVGVFYQQPYYWAISPSQDLTISPEVFQKVNPLLELDYRKRFWSGDLRIQTSVTQEQLFDGDGERLEDSDNSLRSHIFAEGRFALSDTWDWGFAAERVTDDLYLRRYNIDGDQALRGLYSSQSQRLLSQVFAVGQRKNFYSETALVSVQGLTAGDNNDVLPTVAPMSYTEQVFDLGAYGSAAVEASAAILNRKTGADSQRVSLGAEWSRETVLPGGILLEPFAEARGDYYGLDEDFSGEESVARAVGSLGARVSYPLIRRGKNVDIVIEPTAMAAWGVSNANDEVIPNEDSLLFQLDAASLFRVNAASGYDLYEGDGRASVGISARARWRNGVELSTIAGKRWRSRPDDAFSRFSNLDGTSSDWVANTTLDFGRTFTLESGLRLDSETYDINQLDARVTADFWRFRGSAQYFDISDRISPTGEAQQGINLSANMRVTDKFSLVYSRQREIQNDFDRSEGIGISYRDGCSLFQLVYQRSDNRDRELGPSESINFRFSLLTLGDFGSQDVD